MTRGGIDKKLSAKEKQAFRAEIYRYYEEHGRPLPWRSTHDPYATLVSEVMLQQTQVDRVIPYWQRFMETFPDFDSLAAAELREVLAVWQGLGYNRRAKYLHQTAQRIVSQHNGRLPCAYEALTDLPGIGPGTAGAVTAFAFEQPVVFIETNIRRVFIHFFFPGHEKVRDREICPLIEVTLDRKNVRQWYYALMDYGSMLAQTMNNPNRRSAHHGKQSPFEDSDRQIRGMILRSLLKHESMTRSHIGKEIDRDSKRVSAILQDLMNEGLVEKTGKRYRIGSGTNPEP